MARRRSPLSRVVWQPLVPQTDSDTSSLENAGAGRASAANASGARRRRMCMPVVHPPRSGGSLQAERLAEDLAHDLVRAAPDRAEARVARHALDLVLLHVAGAAVDLQRLVGDVEAVALGLQLRHRHLAQRVLALVEATERVVGQGAAGLQLQRHLRDLVAD